MATIHTDKRGKKPSRSIRFEFDGKTRQVCLGQVDLKQARQAKTFLENILHARATGTAPPPAISAWLANLPQGIRKRIERTGLVAKQDATQAPTLSDWLRTYIAGRQDVKPATATVYGHTQRNLEKFFSGRRLDEITPADADGFRVFLTSTERLADNTVRRRMGIAKQFFHAAVRKKILADNPFDGQSCVVRENPSRMHFVTPQESQAVLEACPDAQWRLIFTLCRWGGLRCPSEVLRLKWEDVNWSEKRFVVHAAKTEHHADGGVRIVPLFPEVETALLDVYDQAEPGNPYVITRYREGQNIGILLRKIIIRAGLKPWPKICQNLRSTRETELFKLTNGNIKAVCDWLGNSPLVAMKHYAQVTDEDFESVTSPLRCPSALYTNHGHLRHLRQDSDPPSEQQLHPKSPPAQSGTERNRAAHRNDSIISFPKQPCSSLSPSTTGRYRTRTCDFFLVREAL